MIYMVGVKVQTIRHVTVEAATIEEAEELGLKEAMALVGGIDGTVLEVYSNPRQLVGETERACLQFAQEYLGEENDAD
jgi:hypothetical protein